MSKTVLRDKGIPLKEFICSLYILLYIQVLMEPYTVMFYVELYTITFYESPSISLYKSV